MRVNLGEPQKRCQHGEVPLAQFQRHNGERGARLWARFTSIDELTILSEARNPEVQLNLESIFSHIFTTYGSYSNNRERAPPAPNSTGVRFLVGENVLLSLLRRG